MPRLAMLEKHIAIKVTNLHQTIRILVRKIEEFVKLAADNAGNRGESPTFSRGLPPTPPGGGIQIAHSPCPGRRRALTVNQVLLGSLPRRGARKFRTK